MRLRLIWVTLPFVAHSLLTAFNIQSQLYITIHGRSDILFCLWLYQWSTYLKMENDILQQNEPIISGSSNYFYLIHGLYVIMLLLKAQNPWIKQNSIFAVMRKHGGKARWCESTSSIHSGSKTIQGTNQLLCWKFIILLNRYIFGG